MKKILLMSCLGFFAHSYGALAFDCDAAKARLQQEESSYNLEYQNTISVYDGIKADVDQISSDIESSGEADVEAREKITSFYGHLNNVKQAQKNVFENFASLKLSACANVQQVSSKIVELSKKREELVSAQRDAFIYFSDTFSKIKDKNDAIAAKVDKIGRDIARDYEKRHRELAEKNVDLVKHAHEEAERFANKADKDTRQILSGADEDTRNILRGADEDTRDILRGADEDTRNVLRGADEETRNLLKDADKDARGFMDDVKDVDGVGDILDLAGKYLIKKPTEYLIVKPFEATKNLIKDIF